MTLRQRIKHELENFHSGVEYHVISPEQFTMSLDAYTDRIITEVREALLSDEAVLGVADMRMTPDEYRASGKTRMLGIYQMDRPDTYIRVDMRHPYRVAITAALDAVTTD